MISGRDWIRAKLNFGYSVSEVKGKYDEYCKETGLSPARRTYKRAVEKVALERSKGYKPTNNGHDSDEESASFQDRGNEAFATSTSSRITNLPQLLEACKIDLSDWTVDHHEIVTWEAYRSSKQTHLDYDKGSASGKVQDDGGITTKTLYKVSAFLRRKVLEKSKLPIITPIEIKVSSEPTAKGISSKGYESVMILSDAHIAYRRDTKTGKYYPFHDRDVLSLALQVYKEVKPNYLVFNGDMFDLPDWSDKFVSSPEFYYTLQPSLVELGWWIGKFFSAKEPEECYFIAGNHEDRLRKSILSHLKLGYGLKAIDNVDGYDVISIPHLMGFGKLGIEYLGDYPMGKVWFGDVYVGHGEVIRGKSGETVKTILRDSTHSEICGHIHRNEIAYKTVYVDGGEQKTVFAASFGTMARIDDDSVPPHSNSRKNWQQGFGLLNYDHDNRTSFVEPVVVQRGVTMFRGKLYEAQDVSSQISKDTGWNF